MKKFMPVLVLPCLLLLGACNNKAKDSVEKADSANKMNSDTTTSATTTTTVTTDAETSSFLVAAADGGMSEVKTGELAQQNGMNQRVKDFGAMMVHDHSAGGEQVKALAAARNVTLPAQPGDDNQKVIDKLSKKTGKDFDKAYIDDMVSDHQKDIKEFEDAAGKVGDSAVKDFITNILPTLRMHLDSAKAIQKSLH